MSSILAFPRKEQQPRLPVITISAYWNGPTFYFDVSSEFEPGNVHIATTSSFDVALRAAFEHARKIGLERVRFALTAEDMRGGAA